MFTDYAHESVLNYLQREGQITFEEYMAEQIVSTVNALRETNEEMEVLIAVTEILNDYKRIVRGTFLDVE